MIQEIKYPYEELSELERQRIDDYRGYHMADYKDVHVYYTTEGTLGVGYRIIITLDNIKQVSGKFDFGPTAKEITDEETLLDNF